MDGFVYFYVGVGQSGSGALSSHLFVRLQGQLNVTRPLGLLLGIDLRGARVRGQHNGGEKNVTPITLRLGRRKKKILL